MKLVAHTHIHRVRGKADIRHIRYRAIPEKNKHNRGLRTWNFQGYFEGKKCGNSRDQLKRRQNFQGRSSKNLCGISMGLRF